MRHQTYLHTYIARVEHTVTQPLHVHTYGLLTPLLKLVLVHGSLLAAALVEIRVRKPSPRYHPDTSVEYPPSLRQ